MIFSNADIEKLRDNEVVRTLCELQREMEYAMFCDIAMYNTVDIKAASEQAHAVVRAWKLSDLLKAITALRDRRIYGAFLPNIGY